jgi:uncharacterized protein with GYD domain
MPYYMIQMAYTAEAWAAQVQNPQDRTAVIRSVVEGLGGRLVHRWFSFGEYDAVLITEMPNNISAAAQAIIASAGGGPKAFKTTPLMTVEEGTEALRKAADSGYRPPGA